TSSTWSCCGGTALMATVQVAVLPSLSVTVSVSVYMPARSTKNPVDALLGLFGFEVEPLGREATVQLKVTASPSGSEPRPLGVSGSSAVVLMPAGHIATGGGLVGQPSSTMPSQSSSIRLPQTSVTGPIDPAQAPHTPAEQVCLPATHAPTSVPQGRMSP